MQVSLGMPDRGVDGPQPGLVCESVGNAVVFFVSLEAALADLDLVQLGKFGAAGAAATAGCAPFKAN